MSKEDLLKNSDIISIHLVLGERYKNLTKELGMMKKLLFSSIHLEDQLLMKMI